MSDPRFIHPPARPAHPDRMRLLVGVGLSVPNTQLASYLRSAPGHKAAIMTSYRLPTDPLDTERTADPLVMTSDQLGALAGMIEAWSTMLPDAEYVEKIDTQDAARKGWQDHLLKTYPDGLPS